MSENQPTLPPTSEDKPLTLREACNYLDCSKSYLYKLTSLKAIPHYKPNGKKIFFNKLELKDWLYSNRIKTIKEIDNDAINFIANGKNKKNIK